MQSFVLVNVHDLIDAIKKAVERDNPSNANTIYHLAKAKETAPQIVLELNVPVLVETPTLDMDLSAGEPEIGTPTIGVFDATEANPVGIWSTTDGTIELEIED